MMTTLSRRLPRASVRIHTNQEGSSPGQSQALPLKPQAVHRTHRAQLEGMGRGGFDRWCWRAETDRRWRGSRTQLFNS